MPRRDFSGSSVYRSSFCVLFLRSVFFPRSMNADPLPPARNCRAQFNGRAAGRDSASACAAWSTSPSPLRHRYGHRREVGMIGPRCPSPAVGSGDLHASAASTFCCVAPEDGGAPLGLITLYKENWLHEDFGRRSNPARRRCLFAAYATMMVTSIIIIRAIASIASATPSLQTHSGYAACFDEHYIVR